MKLNDAIVRRIEEICEERGSNICDIALKGGNVAFGNLRPHQRKNKMLKNYYRKAFLRRCGNNFIRFFRQGLFQRTRRRLIFDIKKDRECKKFLVFFISNKH